MKQRFVRSVQARDADVPGYHDLVLDGPKVQRALAGDAVLHRLAAKHRVPKAEIIQQYTPGAYQDPGTGKVSMNAGYDAAHDEGRLEEAIWHLLSVEVQALLTPKPASTTS